MSETYRSPVQRARAMRGPLLAVWALALCALQASAQERSGPMASNPQRPADAAASAAAASAPADFDVNKLFANTCGWCHSNGGRAAGRGPQLMNTARTDEEIIHRIKSGKQGAMPSFGTAFTEDQIKAIVRYIRDLKPNGSTS